MSIFKLYQVKRPFFADMQELSFTEEGMQLYIKNTGFDNMYGKTQLCTVKAQDLEEVFQKTQNIDEDGWVQNGIRGLYVLIGKLPTAGPGCRSTSVGDVIEDDTGKRFLVDTFGFTEL